MNNQNFFMGLLTLAGYLTADGKSISPEPEAILVHVVTPVEEADEEELIGYGWVKDDEDPDGLTWVAIMGNG